MKNKWVLSFLIIFINSSFLISQKINLNYSVNLIPDSLIEGSDAIVRNNIQELNIINESKAYLKEKDVITILKKSGEKFAYLYLPYSSFSKVKNIKGKVYDKDGKLIRTIKKKDIYDFAMHDGFSLYTDNRIKVISKPSENPPYTVEYSYELEMKGILSFPSWNPVSTYKIAIQNSQYKIFSKTPGLFRTKSYNFEKGYSKNIHFEKSNNFYIWTAQNIKPVEKEDYNTGIKNIVPYLLIAPSDFKLDKYIGNAESWQNFGNWIYILNQDRNNLSDETVKKINNLIKNASSDYEKVKIVYEYMQNNTRYVNIAFGIGGWQPFPAEETNKNKYGDCKALSFYTKSLLESIGIKSNYIIIYAGKDAPDLKKDFPSNQFNHAFLCVPFNSDTIWLECTNQKIPFGYIGTFTDDRDALLIDDLEKKGKIIHTKIYSEKENSQIRKIEAEIKENGNVNIISKTIYSGLMYENIWSLLDLPDEEKEKKLKNIIALPGMKLLNFSFKNNKEIIPSAEENLKIEIKKYATLSSDRMFLIPNIFNQNKNVPKKELNRKSDIKLKRGYTYIDTVIYKIPDTYNLEFLPDNIHLSNQFGEYIVSYKYLNSKLIYLRKLIMHKGTFLSSEYNDFRNFLKFVATSDKQTCVFKIKDN